VINHNNHAGTHSRDTILIVLGVITLIGIIAIAVYIIRKNNGTDTGTGTGTGSGTGTDSHNGNASDNLGNIDSDSSNEPKSPTQTNAELENYGYSTLNPVYDISAGLVDPVDDQYMDICPDYPEETEMNN
jgi:hypothetical protein